MLLSSEAGRWHRKEAHSKKFFAMPRHMTEGDVRAHLQGQCWIGHRLPMYGQTDRLVIDLDARRPEEVDERDRLYQSLREFFGMERRVLVWQTPSGFGIRMAYRIPWTDMVSIVKRGKSGLLPEALRAAGFEVRDGELEIFPAENRCDRQLFGRRMPLLDPETLRPIPGADLGDTFNEQKLRAAIELAEEWYEDPVSGLIQHLLDKPRLCLPTGFAESGPEAPLHRDPQDRPSKEDERLAKHGLWEPHSRYQQEFRVGRNMWLWPVLFADLGLPADPTREAVAECLALWLCDRSKGMSDDWNGTLSRMGKDGAIRHWIRTYLRRNHTDNMAPVDRMRLAAVSRDATMLPTVHPAPSERDHILGIAEYAQRQRKLAKTEIYRFEVWACSLLRVAKRQIRREPWDATKREWVRAEIKAEWMASWPWGKRYAYYRSLLEEAGFIKRVAQYRAPKEGMPGRAITYELAQPDWIRRRDLPMPGKEILELLKAIRISGRDVTTEEAYHALHVVDRGIDLAQRYGRETSKIPRMLLDVLRPPVPPLIPEF